MDECKPLINFSCLVGRMTQLKPCRCPEGAQIELKVHECKPLGMGLLRTSAEEEAAGLDESKHGGSAYNMARP